MSTDEMALSHRQRERRHVLARTPSRQWPTGRAGRGMLTLPGELGESGAAARVHDVPRGGRRDSDEEGACAFLCSLHALMLVSLARRALCHALRVCTSCSHDPVGPRPVLSASGLDCPARPGHDGRSLDVPTRRSNMAGQACMHVMCELLSASAPWLAGRRCGWRPGGDERDRTRPTGTRCASAGAPAAVLHSRVPDREARMESTHAQLGTALH